MLLFLLNLVCIIVFAMLTFRLKRVAKSQLLTQDPHYSSAYSFRLTGTDAADKTGGKGTTALGDGKRHGEAYVELEEVDGNALEISVR